MKRTKALLFLTLALCAALLTGEANPSGKLAETMPVRLEDTPCAPW